MNRYLFKKIFKKIVLFCLFSSSLITSTIISSGTLIRQSNENTSDVSSPDLVSFDFSDKIETYDKTMGSFLKNGGIKLPKMDLLKITHQFASTKSKSAFNNEFTKAENLINDGNFNFNYLSNLAKKVNVDLKSRIKNFNVKLPLFTKFTNNSQIKVFRKFAYLTNSNFTVQSYLDKLWSFYNVSAGAAGAAGGVAAAYFAAAAFDFGSTVASGVAATAQVVGLGAQAAIIKSVIDTVTSNAHSINYDTSLLINELFKYSNEHRNDIKDVIEFFNNIKEGAEKIKKVCTIIVGLVTGTIWAAPEGATVEDIADEILATTIDLVLSTVSQAIDIFVDFKNKQLFPN